MTGGEGSQRAAVGTRVPPPATFALAFAAGAGLEAVLPGPGEGFAPHVAAGTALMALGLALAAWFFAAFRRAGTPVDLNKATTSLVVSGPYRISRNPGYLSLSILSAGAAVTAGWRWPLVLLPVAVLAVDRFVIRREERYLLERYGDEYERYRSTTRRWL